jgi:WD repeat-containing protein mio
MMQLEPNQSADLLGPAVVEDVLLDVPIFGPERANVAAIVKGAVQHTGLKQDAIVDELASKEALPKSFTEASTVAAKLRALRTFAREQLSRRDESSRKGTVHNGIEEASDDLETPNGGAVTNKELHEMLLESSMQTRGFPEKAKAVLDHVMLLRAKEKYLFDCEANRKVVSDDPWLRDVWAWIAGEQL